jgi:hypothetical protein
MLVALFVSKSDSSTACGRRGKPIWNLRAGSREESGDPNARHVDRKTDNGGEPQSIGSHPVTIDEKHVGFGNPFGEESGDAGSKGQSFMLGPRRPLRRF